MNTKIRIRKTVIRNKKDLVSVLVDRLIVKSKLIRNRAAQKQESELFKTYISERQSMKKAYAFKAWKDFVNKNCK